MGERTVQQDRARAWLEERRGQFTLSENRGSDGSENHILAGSWDDLVDWFVRAYIRRGMDGVV